MQCRSLVMLPESTLGLDLMALLNRHLLYGAWEACPACVMTRSYERDRVELALRSCSPRQRPIYMSSLCDYRLRKFDQSEDLSSTSLCSYHPGPGKPINTSWSGTTRFIYVITCPRHQWSLFTMYTVCA
jgi:hypothetical protein